MRTTMILLLVFSAAFAAPITAQTEISVGKIEPVSLTWGPQTITAEIINSAEYPVWVSAMMTIEFSGSYLNPSRVYRSNFFAEPAATSQLPIAFDIPWSFGTARMTLELYSVVDTLDDLSVGQKVGESHYELLFRPSDEVLPYTQERITMPPMTENSPLFDADFARIALWMLDEGKSPEQIAAMGKMSTASFETLMKKWRYYGFLATSKVDSSLRPTFVCIPVGMAEKLKPLAEETASKLADFLGRKLKKDYDRVLDSLIREGVVPHDSNSFLHGGTIVYHRYPVIAGLLMWYDWGRGFIVGPGLLSLLEGTDPCNMISPVYMYAVQGGDVFNGHQYYDMTYAGGLVQISYADHIPKILCPEVYPYVDYLTAGGGWTYADESVPELFPMDTTAVHPMIRTLSTGSSDMLNAAFSELKAGMEEYRAGSFTPGVRYWYWNLVASRTVDKLVQKGTLKRHGNGHFRLEGLK